MYLGLMAHPPCAVYEANLFIFLIKAHLTQFNNAINFDFFNITY